MSTVMPIDADERAQLVEAFVAESAEMLSRIEELLPQLEHSADDDEVLHEIFRAAHTIKGSAGCLGLDELAAAAHAVEERLERLRSGEITATPECINALFEEVDELRALAQFSAGGSRKARALRVSTAKLDRMLDLTGEIAIARGNLRELAGGDALHELDRLSAALQELVMDARLVPLGPALRPFHRIVRDVAAKQQKQVSLSIEGGDVELDTAVIEQLRDPITHMVRNAIDHGIESRGTIRIQASREGAGIVIRFSDDGRGLDEAHIAARAKTLGIDADRLSREELFRLIFKPGFTTASAVSDLSGRGVGMDVVRRNVEAMRGSVSVASERGRGTTITLRLPLTVAVIEGFAVTAAGETYVLPIESVVECVEDRQSCLSEDASEDRQDCLSSTGVVDLRGEPLPVVRLRSLFALGNDHTARQNIVVVQHERGRAGLVVDELLGGHSTVMKPLQGILQHVAGIAGSSILGNGRVALVLDPHELVRLAADSTNQ